MTDKPKSEKSKTKSYKRLETLADGLLKVSKEELEAEQKKYSEHRKSDADETNEPS